MRKLCAFVCGAVVALVASNAHATHCAVNQVQVVNQAVVTSFVPTVTVVNAVPVQTIAFAPVVTQVVNQAVAVNAVQVQQVHAVNAVQVNKVKVARARAVRSKTVVKTRVR